MKIKVWTTTQSNNEVVRVHRYVKAVELTCGPAYMTLDIEFEDGELYKDVIRNDSEKVEIVNHD